MHTTKNEKARSVIFGKARCVRLAILGFVSVAPLMLSGCAGMFGGEISGAIPLPGGALTVGASGGGGPLGGGLNAGVSASVPLGVPPGGLRWPPPLPLPPPVQLPPRAFPLPQPRVIGFGGLPIPAPFPPVGPPPIFQAGASIRLSASVSLVADGRGGWDTRPVPGAPPPPAPPPAGTCVSLDDGTVLVSQGDGHWAPQASPERPSSTPSRDLPGGIENGASYASGAPAGGERPSSTPSADLPGGIENGGSFAATAPPAVDRGADVQAP